MEQALERAAAEIQRNGFANIILESVPSRTWGFVARIKWRGEVCARASGCGYDKHGACLADFLRPVCGVSVNGAAGVRVVALACAEAGWILEHTYSGHREHGYTLVRSGGAP